LGRRGSVGGDQVPGQPRLLLAGGTSRQACLCVKTAASSSTARCVRKASISVRPKLLGALATEEDVALDALHVRAIGTVGMLLELDGIAHFVQQILRRGRQGVLLFDSVQAKRSLEMNEHIDLTGCTTLVYAAHVGCVPERVPCGVIVRRVFTEGNCGEDHMESA